MAKIQQEILVLKVSRLLPDSATETAPILNRNALENLEAVVQELSGNGILVELEPVQTEQ